MHRTAAGAATARGLVDHSSSRKEQRNALAQDSDVEFLANGREREREKRRNGGTDKKEGEKH